MKELKTWRDVIQALLDGKHVEYFDGDTKRWAGLTHIPNPSFNELYHRPPNECRIKPKTIMIGDMEVPEPVRSEEEFNKGEIYYFVSPTTTWLYEWSSWEGDLWDLLTLKRGLIHKTEEAAILHAKALVKVSGGSYE